MSGALFVLVSIPGVDSGSAEETEGLITMCLSGGCGRAVLFRREGRCAGGRGGGLLKEGQGLGVGGGHAP